MEKLQAMFLLHFLFIFLVSSSHYHTPKEYFLSCGSNSSVTTPDGRNFIGDKKRHYYAIQAEHGRSVRAENATLVPRLYQTARTSNKAFFYIMDIVESGTYIVRLHFFPFVTSQGTHLSNAIFNVSVTNFGVFCPDNNFLLLSNFSVGNNSNSPVVMEYFLDFCQGFLRMDFIPETASFAFVNAIEIFVLPEHFIESVSLVANALRTVYRVNVGGGTVNDSGALWRTWEQDYDYIFSRGRAEEIINPAVNPRRKPEDIAPLSVYTTCRLLRMPIFYLTWKFQVKKNTAHLIRLHFCDLVSVSSSNVNLQFNVVVYFNDVLTVEPSKATKHSAEPFFHDVVVDSDDSGYLSISIIPNADSQEIIAFLNGLEIMEFINKTIYPLTLQEILIVLSPLFAVFLVLLCLCFGIINVDPETPEYWRGKSHSWIAKKTGYASAIPRLNLESNMPLAELKAATKNFSSKLSIGRGRFGKVYKGLLQNGTNVAVQRSDSRHHRDVYMFQTEVLFMSKIRHQNLVCLIGYCDDGNEKILVYESMKRGTLRDHLYSLDKKSNFKPSGLSWKQSLEICIASAKGLHHLHTSPNGGIIHGNFNSMSIFLDDDCVAKIADFGAPESDIDEAFNFSYCDPEYIRINPFTEKSDVYCFGIVLLDVFCALMPLLSRNRDFLYERRMKWLKKGHFEIDVDPLLDGNISPNSLKKFVEITEKCLNPKGSSRPTMEDVCSDLEHALLLQSFAGIGHV